MATRSSAWSGTTAGERSGIPLTKVDLAIRWPCNAAIEEANPDVIIHAGGDQLEPTAVRRQPALAGTSTFGRPRSSAAWAGEHRRRILFTSTDLVFDGTRSWYREDDPAGSDRWNMAGPSWPPKRPCSRHASGLVVRLSLLYGPYANGSACLLRPGDRRPARGTPQAFFEDEFRTPLDYVTAAAILVRLAESDATGTRSRRRSRAREPLRADAAGRSRAGRDAGSGASQPPGRRDLRRAEAGRRVARHHAACGRCCPASCCPSIEACPGTISRKWAGR